MFILKFDFETAYALEPDLESEQSWRRWLDEGLAAVEKISSTLKRRNAPATFYIVGRVLEREGEAIAAMLDAPLFDIQSHTYTHMHIKDDNPDVLRQFDSELQKTAGLIERYFAHRPIGFCAPGGFYRGLRGHPKQLKILWDNGYMFVSTDGSGPPEQWMPAPFVQPYWYTEEGFPELLEVPVTGWHCNMLFNTGHQNDNWKPAPGFPDGTVLEHLPSTVEEGLQARSREFQYAIDNGLIYQPAMHPWSVFRFDPEMEHLEGLVDMAEENGVPIVNSRMVYEEYVKQPH